MGSREVRISMNSMFVGFIILWNVGFPYIGAFMRELGIVYTQNAWLVVFLVRYIMIRLVSMRLFFIIKRGRGETMTYRV